MSLNRVALIGRLVRDVEIKTLPNGTFVANFTLAVQRDYKNAQGEKETDFINCVVYRQGAEYAANYLSKGKLVSVDGRLQIRTYNDKEGQKRYVTEIICDSAYNLSPRDVEIPEEFGG